MHELTLDNGFRILSVKRGTAPVFFGLLRFRVGSVDDPGGATGLAHLFEHMAFKGTSTIGTRDAAKEAILLDALDDAARALNAELDRVGGADPAKLDAARARLAAAIKDHQALVVRDEFSAILDANGATGLNASTSADATSYYVGLPSNRLELWFLLESARLRDPVLREIYSERNVVLEERRFRLDTNPAGKLYEQLLGAAFQAHPYRIAGVGWPSDLERVTRPQAETFRRAHYVPANAVATLVGDVDPAAVESLARRYFAPIAATPAAPGVGTLEPEQSGERRVQVQFDAEPQIMIAFHKPALADPADPVYEIIDSLLTGGRTSRLFRRLVIEEQVALGLSTFEAPGRRYPNLFVFSASPRAPHGVADVEKSLLAELDRLGAEPPTAAEMEKIRNQVRADNIYALRSNSGLAEQLSIFETITGDWRNLEKREQALLQVTPEQVVAVAKRTFTAKNRTVATLERPAAAAANDAAAAGPEGGGR
ncbi:MAG TPA: pitrilysin family protein [Dongiaceae bacterium]|nr:pitrilysin family protein [Dongiaceae bacterium]